MLVGIAGPSGSGKTALAGKVACALGVRASILSLDSYYRELSHLDLVDRDGVNFDHPDSVDWPLFLDHLDRIAHGEPVAEPVYRFSEHNRAPETTTVQPREFVLVEGILVLHRGDVRERFRLKVYVETPDGVCYGRRMDRGTRERGRTPGSVERQYVGTVRPMAECYVWPSRRWADVVVSGEEPFDRSVARVLEALGQRACAAREPTT